MYVFKDYESNEITTFETQKAFEKHLDSLCDFDAVENESKEKYWSNYADNAEYKTFDGYVFEHFSLGWNKEQNRFSLLGYWTKLPCNKEMK